MKTFKKSDIRAKLVEALERLDNNDIPSEFSLLSNLDRGRVKYRNNRIWDFDFTITYHKGENIVFFNYKGDEEAGFDWQEQTIIKYARKCDITGKGMNEGYCIQDGLMYVKNDFDMLQHIVDETDYDSIEDAYEDDYYYFTDWFDTIDEEEEWYTEDGSLMKSDCC
jgi:hypothetical protein